MAENSVNKPISIRFDQADLSKYKSITSEAGIILAEGIRQLMTEKLVMAEQVKMEGFSVDIEFRKCDQYRSEHIGDLVMTVTPPTGMPADVLDRIIFIIPEFFNAEEVYSSEPFRIDSAYFHRVASAEYTIESKRTSRNVLSFHLYKNQWRAGIYDYGSRLSFKDLEQCITDRLASHVTQTIRCCLINHLPQNRVLPEDEFQKLMRCFDKSQLDTAMVLDSI